MAVDQRGRVERISEETIGGPAHSQEVELRATGGDGGEPIPPKWGTRGVTQGRRGCWALNKQGEPCAATKMRAGDYCASHAGRGVASNPAQYSPLAHEARRRNGAMRAELRLVYGSTRHGGARAALKAAANHEAVRLAGSAINAALDPSIDPLRRGQQALAVIEAAEPKQASHLSVSQDLNPSELSLTELVALAQNSQLSTGESTVDNSSVE